MQVKRVGKRGLALLLSLMIALGTMAIGSGFLTASATSVSTQQAVDWIKARGNEAWNVNYNNDQWGCQCVDLINAYYNFLGYSWVSGNACDYLNASKWPAGWYMDRTPSPGAIECWGAYTWTGQWTTGWTGHVGLVYAVSGSTVYTVETNTAGSDYGSPAKFCTRMTTNAYYIHPNFTDHSCDYMASAKITKAPTRTASGTRVRTCSCGKTLTETIPAIPYTTDLAEGIYTVTSKLKSNLRMTCISSYNVCVWNDPGADSYWLFRKNSDGTYTIENAYYNNRVLDVEGISLIRCTNIFGCTDNGGDNQRFYVIPAGSYYRLVAKHSYLTVDNINAGTSDGNNIIQHEDNGSDAQRWAIKLSNPSLSLSATSLTLSPGSSKTVNCTIGRATYGSNFRCTVADSTVCDATWGEWNGWTCPLTITGRSAGTTTVTVSFRHKATGIVYGSKTITVTVPDTDKPSVSISSANSVAASQTATLTMSDNVGIAGYYWGTSSSYSGNPYTSTSGRSVSLTKSVTAAGTYYLTAKDTSGNVSPTVSKTFYKTTLNANGGSVSPSSVITASGNSFTLPTPTRSGYKFKSWNTASGGSGTSCTGAFKPSGSVTLYAQWTNAAYTVTFNANGGTCDTSSKSVTYNTSYGTLPTPSRTGYKFNGWYTAASGGTKITEQSTVSTASNHTLYAHWIVKPIAKITSTNAVADKQTVTLTMHDDNGLAGYYWGTSSTSTSNAYVKLSGKDKTVNVTVSSAGIYYLTVESTSGAQASTMIAFYETTLNAGGGSVTPQSVLSPNTLSTSSDSPVSSNLIVLNQNKYGLEFTLPAATRTGFTFCGWNTKADGSGKTYAAGDSFRYYIIYGQISSGGLVMTGTIDSATALYAQWTAKSYTVRFNGNGATSGTMADQSFTYGEQKALTPNAFRREYTVNYNYNDAASTVALTSATAKATFNGWAVSSNGSKVYSDRQQIQNLTTNGSVTLFADWTLGTVTLPAPTRSGCTFRGWNTKADGKGTNYAAGAAYTPIADVTLYAQWEKNATVQYTLTYNANGGVDAPAAKSGNGMICLAMLQPTRDGYTFLGWAQSSTATTAQYTSGASFNLTADSTLYAVWKKSPAGSTTAPTDEPNTTPSISIRNFVASRAERYLTTVKFHALTENKPAGARVEWYINGRKKADDSESFAYYGATQDYTVQVKLVSSEGDVLAESETETVRISSDIIDMLISLWRILFNIPHYVEQ